MIIIIIRVDCFFFNCDCVMYSGCADFAEYFNYPDIANSLNKILFNIFASLGLDVTIPARNTTIKTMCQLIVDKLDNEPMPSFESVKKKDKIVQVLCSIINGNSDISFDLSNYKSKLLDDIFTGDQLLILNILMYNNYISSLPEIQRNLKTNKVCCFINFYYINSCMSIRI